MIIRLRRGNVVDWGTVNPVLESGEFGVSLDAHDDAGSLRFKIGDGVTAWDDLPYVSGTVTLAALRALLDGVYQPQLTTVGSYAYNTDGTVASDPTGKTYAYNTDGSIHSETLDGATRIYSYNTDGTIASVA